MDPVLFLQFIKCYGIDINAWDRGFLAKKCKKRNEKSHIETSYIYFDNAFINTASKNSWENNSIFNNSCRKFNFFHWTGKNAKKWGFNPIKNIFTHQYFSVLSASLIKYDQ